MKSLLPFLLIASNLCAQPHPDYMKTGKKELHYLALGDSYTIGESVSSAENFPHQLEAELKKKGFTVHTDIIATTGWTTRDLKEAIARADLSAEKYNIVSLLIGVNNQYQGKSLEEYSKEFGQLLETAVRLAGGKKELVFVVSIPDYSYTPFGEEKKESISREIDAFNAENRKITLAAGIKYADITAISRTAITQPEFVAADGLHPSGEQYREWVKIILNSIEEILKYNPRF